ncbi:MAG: hypothetical protein AB8B70_00015 [Prochlorococcus sp.]|nr:hypothetical protein [Prochlorococcaceae cyanobacterium Fu_MAG_50]
MIKAALNGGSTDQPDKLLLRAEAMAPVPCIQMNDSDTCINVNPKAGLTSSGQPSFSAEPQVHMLLYQLRKTDFKNSSTESIFMIRKRFSSTHEMN